jgi:hypothetical protein
MQNAHERFGALEFTRRTKDTITRVRVQIDRAVLELQAMIGVRRFLQ